MAEKGTGKRLLAIHDYAMETGEIEFTKGEIYDHVDGEVEMEDGVKIKDVDINSFGFDSKTNIYVLYNNNGTPHFLEYKDICKYFVIA